MKNIFKKLSCALLAAAMICAITPFTASAATQKVSYPKTLVTYMDSKTNHFGYGSIYVSNVPNKSSISKSSVKIKSGGSVVSLSNLSKTVWTNRSESFYKGAKPYTYTDHTYNISFNTKKTGNATISFKVGSQTCTTKIKVLPYSNPLKSLTVTGVKGNLASKFKTSNSASDIRVNKAQKNAFIKCTAANGWKITSLNYSNRKTNVQRNIYCNSKGVSSVSLHAGDLAAKQTGYINISLTNTKTGGTQSCYVNLG
ncbi:MAG: hypothetical protein Q4P27_03870 [Eubacteriales bacterium]|nr:hypothetical protein [Eubacteriales bacterium]